MVRAPRGVEGGKGEGRKGMGEGRGTGEERETVLRNPRFFSY